MPKRKSEGQRTMVLLWWDCFSHDLWRFSHGRNMTNAQRLWNTSVPTYNFRTKTPVFSPTVGQKTGTCQKCWPNLPLSAPEWSICNGTWKVPPVLVGWGTVQNMLVKLDHETWRTIGVRKISYLWKHHLVMAEPLGLGLLDPPPKIRSFGSNPPFLVGKKNGGKNCQLPGGTTSSLGSAFNVAQAAEDRVSPAMPWETKVAPKPPEITILLPHPSRVANSTSLNQFTPSVNRHGQTIDNYLQPFPHQTATDDIKFWEPSMHNSAVALL